MSGHNCSNPDALYCPSCDGDETRKLQARVKELEGQLCDAIDEINACADLIDPRKAKEIVRLRKVVDAAREATTSNHVLGPPARTRLAKALRELDGEKP